ncbi:MAG: FAD-binding oxidoreductase [Acetobacteraceae bacterium]|nr:FAD-binding oxidoreductase [Acetobacteraceae bacterium]
MHVAVVGAGIVGVTVAHALLDEQHQVTLIDREGVAAGASAGNAGMIAHVDILPLASAKVWRNLPRWLADPLGPLAIRPAYLPALLPWLARFIAASFPGAIADGTRALTSLNACALPAWERRLASLGLDGHLRRRGFLSVWPSASAFAASAALRQRQNDLGIPNRALTPAEVRALEPALAGPVGGGALYETGVHVSDPRQLTRALASAALERQMTLVYGAATSLTGGAVRLEDGRTIDADRIVLACGAWSRPLVASLGDAIPLDTERGYNVTFEPGRFGLSRPVVFEGEGFVASTLDVGDRIGGAVEFGGLSAPPRWARVDAMLGKLRRYLPHVDASGGTRWMGFRPSMPDSLPVIGPSPSAPHVIHAFGHGHYGLTQAAATAEIVACLVAGRNCEIDRTPFDPARF